MYYFVADFPGLGIYDDRTHERRFSKLSADKMDREIFLATFLITVVIK